MRNILLLLALVAGPALNAEVEVRSVTLKSVNADVPVDIAVPPGKGPFPPVCSSTPSGAWTRTSAGTSPSWPGRATWWPCPTGRAAA